MTWELLVAGVLIALVAGVGSRVRAEPNTWRRLMTLDGEAVTRARMKSFPDRTLWRLRIQ